jgi:predicted ABC-type sugar transport system permease subunit
MLQQIWIILVLITASWAIAETTDDVRMKEHVLQMFDDVRADEIVLDSAKNWIVLRGNVQLSVGRADLVICNSDALIIQDQELKTYDRFSIGALGCRALIDLLRARGWLP